MSKLRAFTMPKWGIEMQEGTVSEWSIREGDSVTKGQVVAQIETDKIVNELAVEYDATVARLVAEVGETYPVGALLAVMAFGETSAEDLEAFVRGFSSGGSAEPPKAAAALSTGTATAQSVPGVAAGQTEISRGARQLAMRLGVDTSTIKGSGRRGRITLQDVDQAGKHARPATSGPSGSTPPARGATAVRMSATRRAIARQLTHSKATIPHFYLRTDVRLDSLLATRAQLKQRGGSVPSINDYFIKASALALIEVPDVNIQVHGDEIHRFDEAHVAVAVATERGLMTPVLRSAHSKPLAQLSAESRTLAERARAGQLTGADLQGGSFTVSNLGMYGIDQFDAIINPPQGAILAVGATRRLAAESDGKVVFGTVACVSLSCDHRAIDGAVGAAFLRALKRHIEAPQSL